MNVEPVEQNRQHVKALAIDEVVGSWTVGSLGPTMTETTVNQALMIGLVRNGIGKRSPQFDTSQPFVEENERWSRSRPISEPVIKTKTSHVCLWIRRGSGHFRAR